MKKKISRFGVVLGSAMCMSTARADSAKMLQRWEAWTASRPKACDSRLDSRAEVDPSHTRVALVLHGYASSIPSLDGVFTILRNNGYDILAPRLSRHFTTNLRDMDNVRYQEWIDDSEQAFAIARASGRKVTLVGFSLGGLLASRLALEYPSAVERVVLVAPMWRISQESSVASLAGSILHISLNEYEHLPISCTVDGGYTSSSGVRKLEYLQIKTENEHGNWDAVSPFPTVFNQIVPPQLVITSSADTAVDSAEITAMCASNTTCIPVSVPRLEHTEILGHLSNGAQGRFSGHSLASVINGFLH